MRDTSEYFANKEERRQLRRDRLEYAAGMSNFFGVILGILVILLLIMLILSLLNWLRNDISATFNILRTRF